MKYKLTFLLVLLFTTMIFGQTTGKIKGVVKDDGGDPISGAFVTVEGTTMGAQTDENGYYYIIGVRAGTYKLKCQFIGYRTSEKKVFNIKVGLTATVDFRMNCESDIRITSAYKTDLFSNTNHNLKEVINGLKLYMSDKKQFALIDTLHSTYDENRFKSFLNCFIQIKKTAVVNDDVKLFIILQSLLNAYSNLPSTAYIKESEKYKDTLRTEINSILPKADYAEQFFLKILKIRMAATSEEKISSYNELLQEKTQLEKVPFEGFEDLISYGSSDFRPLNLYDFVYNQYIETIQNIQRRNRNSEQTSALKFLIDFTELRKFDLSKESDIDSIAYLQKAYIGLLEYYKDKQKDDLFFNLEINRLSFIADNHPSFAKYIKNGIDSAKFYPIADRYKKNLNTLLDRSNNDYIKCRLEYEITKNFYANYPNSYKYVDKNRQDDFYRYCRKIIDSYPANFLGVRLTQNLLNSKDLGEYSWLHAEKWLETQKPYPVLIKYRGLKNIYFKIYKLSNFGLVNEEDLVDLLDKQPLQEHKIKLNEYSDKETHTTEIVLPGLEKGRYVILSCSSREFNQNISHISCITVEMTDIAFINTDRTIRFINRSSGNPLKNIQIINNGIPETTDSNGLLIKKAKQNYYNFLVLHQQDSLLYSDENYDGYWQYNGLKQKTTRVFTDRKIYRPGQTLYFKTVASQFNRDSLKLHPAGKFQKIGIKLQVRNGMYGAIIKSIVDSTDSFSTFSDSIQIPLDIKTGDYKIVADNGFETVIYIENYKRNIYEIKPNDNAVTFNDSILQLGGSVLAYTGYKLKIQRIDFSINLKGDKSIIATGNGNVVNETNFDINLKTDQINRYFNRHFDSGDKSLVNFEIKVTVVLDNGESFNQILPIDYNHNDGFKFFGSRNIDIAKQRPAFTLNYSSVAYSKVDSILISVYSLNTPDSVISLRLWNKPEQLFYTENLSSKANPACYYNLSNENTASFRQNKLIKQQVVKNQNPYFQQISDLNLFNGCYRIIARSAGGLQMTDSMDFVVYNSKKAQSPIATPLLVDLPERTINKNSQITASIYCGFQESMLYWESWVSDSILSRGNQKLSFGINTMTMKPPKYFSGIIRYRFITFKNNRPYVQEIDLTVNDKKKQIGLSVINMPKTAVPGKKYHWKIKTTRKHKVQIAAVLYDAALDAFANHSWQYDLEKLSDIYRPSPNPVNLSTILKEKDIVLEYEKANTHIPDDLLNFKIKYDSYGLMLVACTIAPESGERSVSRVQNFLNKSFNNPTQNQDSFQSQHYTNTPFSYRQNFAETAFFFPALVTDANGEATLDFTLPESLTRWKLMLLAITEDGQTEVLQKEIISSKAVLANSGLPRFFRTGDKLKLSVTVANGGNEKIKGITEIKFFSPDRKTEITADFIKENSQKFSLKSGSSESYYYDLAIPESFDSVIVKISAVTDKGSDGEERTIPVLKQKVLITETKNLSISTQNSDSLDLTKAFSSQSDLQKITLNIADIGNTTKTVLKALPYLMDYPYGCMEQTFGKFYGNCMAMHIYKTNNQIKKAANFANDSLTANKNLSTLFDQKRLNEMKNIAFNKLMEGRRDDGSWSWFAKGDLTDNRTSNYIATGFALLKTIGAVDEKDDPRMSELLNSLKNNYGNFYQQKSKAKIDGGLIRAAFITKALGDNYTKFAIIDSLELKSISGLSFEDKLYLVLLIKNISGDQKAVALWEKIKPELTENLKNYRVNYYEPDLLSLSVICLKQLAHDPDLQNKLKAQILSYFNGKYFVSTKATALACYALLDNSESDSENLVEIIADAEKISLNSDQLFKSDEKVWNGKNADLLRKIVISNKSKNFVAAAVSREYYSDVDKIKTEGNDLKITRTVFKVENDKLININDTDLKVGDKIRIVLEIEAAKQMDYVHITDKKPSGIEPLTVLSGYKYNKSLDYFESPADNEFNFFLNSIYPGKHQLEYDAVVNLSGEISGGYSRIYEMYNPKNEAYSGSGSLVVK